MPKLRRPGTVGLFLTAYDIWRRLPPKQRRALLNQAKTHGPRIAKLAVDASRKSRAGR